MAASVIMEVAFGYKVGGLDDVFIEHARETSQITGQAMAPGRWLVESIPICEPANYFYVHSTSFFVGVRASFSEIRPCMAPWGGIQEEV